MFCRKCGAELEPHENFCPFCGEKVLEIQGAEPVQQPKPTEPMVEPQPVAPIHKTKQNSARKKIGIIVGVIAAVAALVLGAYLISRGNAGNKEPFVSSDNTGNTNDFDEPNDTVNTTPEPEVSPDNTLITEEPMASPGTPGTSSTPTTTEPTKINSATVDLSSLYIGMWIAKGQSEGDTRNGWTALCVDSVNGGSVTFRLEKIQSAPANRIADTYPITVALESGAATFPVSDSWGNSGTGEITVKDGVIHVTVNITNPDPMSLWDVSMDTDFYSEQISTVNVASNTIKVVTNSGTLSLKQDPCVVDGQVMVPMEEVFRAVGIQVVKESSTYVCLSKDTSVVFVDYGDESLYAAVNSSMPDFSITTNWVNNVLFVPWNLLDTVFDIPCNWNESEKKVYIKGEVSADKQVNSTTAEALKNFDMNAAIKRVQDAGYTLAEAGSDSYYMGTTKYWNIPVVAAESIQYMQVSYNGTYYNMSKIQ